MQDCNLVSSLVGNDFAHRGALSAFTSPGVPTMASDLIYVLFCSTSHTSPP